MNSKQRAERLLNMSKGELVLQCQDLERECDEWKDKAATWMASPEAAQRLAGYREMGQRAEKAERQRDELLVMLRKMNRAYVALLESGRDRILDHGGQCDPVDVMEKNDPYLIELRALIAKVENEK